MNICAHRHFTLYLRTNDQLFTDDFRAIVVGEDGQERHYPINRHNYFIGHVVGNDRSHVYETLVWHRITSCCVAGEENSRVQAHMDENEFSAHILLDGGEYNVEVSTAPNCLTRAHNKKVLRTIFLYMISIFSIRSAGV